MWTDCWYIALFGVLGWMAVEQVVLLLVTVALELGVEYNTHKSIDPSPCPKPDWPSNRCPLLLCHSVDIVLGWGRLQRGVVVLPE